MITITQPGDAYIVQPSDSVIRVTTSPALIVFGPTGAVKQAVTVSDRTQGLNGDVSLMVPGLGPLHLTHGQMVTVKWDSVNQVWYI